MGRVASPPPSPAPRAPETAGVWGGDRILDVGADDPWEWFSRPVLDGSGLEATPGAELAARIEELAVAMFTRTDVPGADAYPHDVGSADHDDAGGETDGDEPGGKRGCERGAPRRGEVDGDRRDGGADHADVGDRDVAVPGVPAGADALDDWAVGWGGGRLSRHDAVEFIAATHRQIAHLQAVAAQVATVLTWDAAYHSCAPAAGWARDDGTGRACPSCAYGPDDIPIPDPAHDSGTTTSGTTTSGTTTSGTTGSTPDPVADRNAGADRTRWPTRESGNRSPVGLVGLELSAALQVSPGYATGLVTFWSELVESCPATWAALWDGRIDDYRARSIVEGTRPLLDGSTAPDPRTTATTSDDAGHDGPGHDDPASTIDDDDADDEGPRERLRSQVEAEALTRAPSQTGALLRRRVRRLVNKADPEVGERARARQRADRAVSQPYTPADAIAGCATMSLRGPVEDLQALYAAVDAAARHARTNGDDRTLDQLRFDILTGTAWTALRLDHLGCCNPAHTADHEAAAGRTVPDTPGTTGTGNDRPDDGPHCAVHDDPPDHPLGDRLADQPPPGKQRRHDRPDADPPLVDPPGNELPDADLPGDRAPRLATQARRPVQIRVTVPLSTLLGITDSPAELAGAGPIPASVARTLAFSDDATWRRLVTDPVDGTLLDYGHSTYRPPAPLAGYVTARDQQCRFPTTTTPADACDLDHTIPFGSAGGVTAAHNLGALSRRAHNARTHHHWHLAQPAAGHFAWTSPARHTYAVSPDALDADTSTGANTGSTNGTTRPRHDDEPIPF